MNPGDLIFSAQSRVDLGLAHIYLTAGGIAHLNLGHRDIALLPITLLKEAVERPTEVYRSHIVGRVVLYSSEVQKEGHPMAVMIERTSDGGKIITASWKDKIQGSVIWESTSGIYASHDEDSDILYVSRGVAVPSYAVEDAENPDFWFRYSMSDNSHTGVTIFRAGEIWRSKFEEMTRRVSDFLEVSHTQISERLSPLLTV